MDSDNWWKELDSQVRQAKQFGVQGEIEAAKAALEVGEQKREDIDRELLKLIRERQPKEPERIYGFKKMNPKKKRNAICNWLVRKGVKSGKERFIIARADGSLVTFKKGTETGVRLGERIEKFLDVSDKNRFILYHNHPLSGSFSYDDMKTLNMFPSLKEMVAVGHNGTIYSLTAGKRLSKEEFVELSKHCSETQLLLELVKKYKWKYNPKLRR